MDFLRELLCCDIDLQRISICGAYQRIMGWSCEKKWHLFYFLLSSLYKRRRKIHAWKYFCPKVCHFSAVSKMFPASQNVIVLLAILSLSDFLIFQTKCIRSIKVVVAAVVVVIVFVLVVIAIFVVLFVVDSSIYCHLDNLLMLEPKIF